MNSHYMLTLFDDTVRTVGVRFQGLGKTYTYKTRLPLEIGDSVVVETSSNGLQVVTVARIDEDPDIAPDSAIDYKWIVCKVDLETYTKDVERDNELLKQIRAMQRKRHREQARAAIAAELPGLALAFAEQKTHDSREPLRKTWHRDGFEAARAGKTRSACPFTEEDGSLLE